MDIVAFSGSRDLDTSPGSRAYALLEQEIAALAPGTLVIHGDNGNVDWTARDMARARGLPVKPFPADWKRYKPTQPGRKNPAGMIRNREMALFGPKRWIIVWDGKSPGSAGALKLAQKHGIPFTEHDVSRNA